MAITTEVAIARLDKDIQHMAQVICAEMSLPYTSLVANWTLVMDERLFEATGKFAGDSIFSVSKPEQPTFISEKLLERGHEQIVMRHHRIHDDEDEVDAEGEE